MELGDFKKRQKAKENLPLLSAMGAIDQSDEAIFEDVPDFHRRIKAEFLRIAPTQLVRETTLAPGAFLNKANYPIRKTQDAATVAWNLATGLYYKTQPKPPWRLADVRPGVCYIGMVYKSLPNDPDGHACCAAQMFLSEGDGVVFRGANGPWKTGDYEYHLKAPAAKDLLELVLKTYSEEHGGPPKELFIHGQTYFNDEEWNAFIAAAPKETNVVGVRIRPTGGETKLFRDGDYPVLRGTALLLDDQTAYLWTTGYVPQLDTYMTVATVRCGGMRRIGMSNVQRRGRRLHSAELRTGRCSRGAGQLHPLCRALRRLHCVPASVSKTCTVVQSCVKMSRIR